MSWELVVSGGRGLSESGIVHALTRHGRYWLVLLIGVAAIFGLGNWSLQTAPTVIDEAVVLAAMQYEASNPPLPRAMQGAPAAWSKAASVEPDSTAFAHARYAPPALESVDPTALDDMKRAVSERIVDDDASPWHHGDKTGYRTMCVRLCDGAYFPVSYATTRDRLADDEAKCASRCSGAPTRLYAFPHPGGSPEMMQDRAGRSYVALPTAFQFRRGVVAGCSCQPQPWDEASRQRHRLYALEADRAAGRTVDATELAALRENTATVANNISAARDDASITAIDKSEQELVGRIAAEPASSIAPPGTRVELISAFADYGGTAVISAATASPVAALQSLARTEPTELRRQTAADVPLARAMELPDESLPAAAPADRAPPLPVVSALRGEEHASAASTPLSRTSLRKSAKQAKAQRGRRSATMHAPHKRRGKSTIEAAKQHAAAEPAESVSAGLRKAIGNKSIWGVGPNARSAPRGGSAYDTFARNFF